MRVGEHGQAWTSIDEHGRAWTSAVSGSEHG